MKKRIKKATRKEKIDTIHMKYERLVKEHQRLKSRLKTEEFYSSSLEVKNSILQDEIAKETNLIKTIMEENKKTTFHKILDYLNSLFYTDKRNND
jgi:hypothetical protein